MSSVSAALDERDQILRRHAAIRRARCLKCGAEPGEHCKAPSGRVVLHPHQWRRSDAYDQGFLPLPAQVRAIRLAALAQTLISGELPPQGTLAIIDACAGPGLTGAALDAAWAEYLDAAKTEADFDAGLISASQICEDLTVTDRQGAAADMLRQAAADALAAIVTGRQS